MRCALGVLIAVTMVGCGDGEGPFDGLLRPPASGDGMQLSLRVPVQPGEELTVCKNFGIPSGSFDIGRFEHAMNGASHHLLVFPILLASTLVTDEVFYNCDEDPQAQGDRIGFMYGSQSPSGDVKLPTGIAFGAMTGIAVQMEFHIFNAGDEPLDAEAVVNLWRTREEIVGEAGTIFALNSRLIVPPMSTGSARQRCRIAQDINLLDLTPHMHSRGTAMQVYLDRGDGSPELVVDAPGWDEDTVRFDPPLAIGPGDVLDIQCQYNNTSDRYITHGQSAKNDEMCVTGGLYYRQGPRMTLQDEICVGSEGVVFEGSNSCMQVDQCLHTIDLADWDTVGPKFELCVQSGCQTGAEAFTRFDSCRWEQCNPQCYTRSGDQVTALTFDSTACTDCLQTMCATERDACATATCP